MKKLYGIFALISLLFSCQSKQKADLIVYNGIVYTVNEKFEVAEALAVKDGKILAVGTTKDILNQYEAPEKTDVQGQAIYPGFIDAHSHFYRYGLGLQTVDLTGTKSWDEIIQKVAEFSKNNPSEWIIGRGWDQNDWAVKEFPSKERLDSLLPDKPVILTRIDGHAAIANQNALQKANIKPGQTLTGGTVEVRNGKLTGILIDNAVDLVGRIIPAPNQSDIEKALLDAQQNCFAVGLTTVDDCGLMANEAEAIDALQKSGKLKMRVYVMLSDDSTNYARYLSKGPYKTDKLNIRSFKIYGDGALGSRGACLLEPYADRHDWSGFLLSKPEHFRKIARLLANTDFQMCTHAIGDSANREILEIYGEVLKGKNDKRWRIEHAQVVNEKDFAMFANYNVVPSVQPTHATSDMYWAEQRLGSSRVKYAYAYKDLLKQNNWLPLGTDFPVEDISPFKTFLASTFRVDAKGYPQGGFQKENALTREETLKGMTIWAAKSNFEEKEKGSLEPGKFADFIILNQDLMKVESQKVLETKVIATFIGGEQVYKK
ncbi:amidohydrolase [Xanthocytophaga flava]|uniref:amidohydrolase n=1 Tax=Xanthocytophaga flava TaxID=3048013 RepID=UPI0028D8DA2C|nr:amidohydrolase [Xanthocytophaga flavus]MDJ1473061.1 amidohydrolase [Xanthocytophaga flavus]